jgi:hypothetical protein
LRQLGGVTVFALRARLREIDGRDGIGIVALRAVKAGWTGNWVDSGTKAVVACCALRAGGLAVGWLEGTGWAGLCVLVARTCWAHVACGALIVSNHRRCHAFSVGVVASIHIFARRYSGCGCVVI